MTNPTGVQDRPLRSAIDDIISYPRRLDQQGKREIIVLEQGLRSELQGSIPIVETAPEERYTLTSMVVDLLPRLEAWRKYHLATGESTDVRQVVSHYVDALGEQFKAEYHAEGSERYWEEMSMLMKGNFTNAYLTISRRKNRMESSAGYRYGYGNQSALATATAIPGLMTLRMPYSTPLVMGALAAVGYKIVHPLIQKLVNEDILRLAEFTVHQQKRINETTIGERSEEKHFQLNNVMRDLLPKLEVSRLAHQESAPLETITKEYLERLHFDFDKAGKFNEEYWIHLQTLVMDEFLPRFGTYAAAQTRAEEKGLFYKMVSNKWVGAIGINALLAPLYLISARVLPFGVVDDLLMMGLLGVGGYNLPKLINPGHEPIERIYTSICGKQDDVLKLAGLLPQPVKQLQSTTKIKH